MTGELHVKIATMPYNDFPDGVQIVGNIYPADRGGTSHRDVLFPAGPSTPPARFAVAPGRYVIEATLPNSDVLSDEAEVAEGQVGEVYLDCHPVTARVALLAVPRGQCAAEPTPTTPGDASPPLVGLALPRPC